MTYRRVFNGHRGKLYNDLPIVMFIGPLHGTFTTDVIIPSTPTTDSSDN